MDDIWPLPESWACNRCGACMMASGGCKRKDRSGRSRCSGKAERVKVYRARCECCRWTCTKAQLMTRCRACHHRIRAFTELEVRLWEMAL